MAIDRIASRERLKKRWHQRCLRHLREAEDQDRPTSFATPANVASRSVDLRFTDLFGAWQHFSIPVGEMTEDLFKEGIGFDGSSIRGFQKIFESDMLLFPDAGRTFVDSTLEIPTMAIVCDIKDPLTLSRATAAIRAYVAHKAEEYLLSTGIRRHVVLGAGARVLHLQLDPLRPEHPRGVLPHRF